MADLLIRDISNELKSRIEDRARETDVSLSDAAKNLIQRGFADSEAPRRLGTEMFELLPAEFRSDDLVFEIPGFAEDPPDFS